MPGPPALRLPRRGFVAIVLIGLLALFLAAWGTLSLEARGYDREYAHNLMRLAVLPVFAVLCWLLVRDRRRFLRRLWTCRALTWRIALAAVAIGLLARLLAWSHRFAEIAFGWNINDEIRFSYPFTVVYECPSAGVLFVSLLVWWIVIPLVEEFVHRGLLMSALISKGPVVAVGMSTMIFASAHAPHNFFLPLFFGIVFGIQFWNTRTIWAPVITHAAYDGFIPFDSYCTDIRWQPGPEDLPMRLVGYSAIVTGIACAALIAWLVAAIKPDSVAARPVGLAEARDPTTRSQRAQ